MPAAHPRIIGMILDNRFPPDPRVENEAQKLLEQGHTVHLFCIEKGSATIEKEIIRGIHVHRFGISKFTYKFSALAYTTPVYHWIMKSKIQRFLIDNKIEVVHVHDLQIARSVAWILKSLPIANVLDLHENRPEIMKYYTHVNSFSGKMLIHPKIWARYEARYIRYFQRIIVVTQEAKDLYVKTLNVPAEKIAVVSNSVDKDYSAEENIDNRIVSRYSANFTLIYVGETGKRRGLETAIEALDILRSEIPHIKLIVVGKSVYDDTLKLFAEKKGVTDLVDFLGWQQPSTFPSYIAAADIGISPLHRNIHHDTTYANKIAQYLAHGKPVVASDCTAQKVLLESNNCGLSHKAEDAQDFARAVLKLYKNREFYQSLSQNALKAIQEKLNWGETSKPLVTLYKEIGEERKSATTKT